MKNHFDTLDRTKYCIMSTTSSSKTKDGKKLIRIVHLIRLLHLYVNSLISTWWTGIKKIHFVYLITSKMILKHTETNEISLITFFVRSLFKRKTKVAQLQNICKCMRVYVLHVRIALCFVFLIRNSPFSLARQCRIR